jgi:hypothetical protein
MPDTDGRAHKRPKPEVEQLPASSLVGPSAALAAELMGLLRIWIKSVSHFDRILIKVFNDHNARRQARGYTEDWLRSEIPRRSLRHGVPTEIVRILGRGVGKPMDGD